jgi:hypothetical protein
MNSFSLSLCLSLKQSSRKGASGVPTSHRLTDLRNRFLRHEPHLKTTYMPEASFVGWQRSAFCHRRRESIFVVICGLCGLCAFYQYQCMQQCNACSNAISTNACSNACSNSCSNACSNANVCRNAMHATYAVPWLRSRLPLTICAFCSCRTRPSAHQCASKASRAKKDAREG